MKSAIRFSNIAMRQFPVPETHDEKESNRNPAQRSRWGWRGGGLAFLLAVVLSLAAPSEATLTFQRSTDLLGVATLLEEGTGLPTRNFTLSVRGKGSSGRNVVNLLRAGYACSLAYYPERNWFDIILDSTSYAFNPSTKVNAEEAIMTMRTWTVTYDDFAGELSLYIDAVHIGTLDVAPLFPGVSIFSVDAISYITFGPTTFESYDDEGKLALVPLNEIDGFYGAFGGMQLWDRALNGSEIRHATASTISLTGNEEGLCIYWRADRGYGERIPNLGSGGADYAAVLGQYAKGIGHTSATFGSGCGTSAVTSPAWDNTTGGTNTRPIADNHTLQVIESTSGSPTSVSIYFTGVDDDGDLLNFAVTSLPSHGRLELESTVNSSEPRVILTNTPFKCWDTFSRYRLVWWPEANSEEDITIGVKAWDGSAFSGEATIEIGVLPIDGVPKAVDETYTMDEDTELHNISLRAADADSMFLSLFVVELPTHGALYKASANDSERLVKIEHPYSEWEIVTPVEQFVSNVRSVSTFWPAGDDAGNGYPSWHPFQILGAQDAPNLYGDSNLAFCPSSLLGDYSGIQSGGDSYITFSHNTWASYLSYGFTEFIEVGGFADDGAAVGALTNTPTAPLLLNRLKSRRKCSYNPSKLAKIVECFRQSV